MKRFLLAATVVAGLAVLAGILVPETVGAAGARAARGLCSMAPETCLRWKQTALEGTVRELETNRALVQQGLRLVDEHGTELRQRLDALTASAGLLAQRELDRRARGAAALEFSGRLYAAGQVEEQARLWTAEAAAYRATIEHNVEGRRRQFTEARERLALAHARADSARRNIEADLPLLAISRGLDRVRDLAQAADAATREAVTLADPVRSILQVVPESVPTASARTPGFDFEAWLGAQRAEAAPRG